MESKIPSTFGEAPDELLTMFLFENIIVNYRPYEMLTKNNTHNIIDKLNGLFNQHSTKHETYLIHNFNTYRQLNHLLFHAS